MAVKMMAEAAKESGIQNPPYGTSPNKISNAEHGKYLNKLFKDIADNPTAKAYITEELMHAKLGRDLIANSSENKFKELAAKMPEYDFKKLDEFKYKSPAPEVRTIGSGMNTLGKVVGPAIAVAQGATVAQGIMDKMKAGESFKEAATNPELVKDAARGVMGYIGANAGALAGSMAPGGLPAKAGAELAGAVGGGYVGAKLADLLTGNPVLDKIIRDRYEKARNERMAKTKPTAASSVELRPGE